MTTNKRWGWRCWLGFHDWEEVGRFETSTVCSDKCALYLRKEFENVRHARV